MRFESGKRACCVEGKGNGMGNKIDSKGSALLLLVIILAMGHLPLSSAAGQDRPGATKSTAVRLFDTIEFRSNLRALPQWLRVLSVVEEQITEYRKCRGNTCSSAARSWRKMIRQAKNKTPMEMLKTVNAFVNQWPYRLDSEVYGKSDYWASPHEFLKQSGDCEDYSIIKYFALQQLGFKAEKMRIVVVRDQIRNIGHAVLAVYMDDTAIILDNLSNMVLPHHRYRHYLPQYSVNGVNRWAHVRPIGKQGY